MPGIVKAAASLTVLAGLLLPAQAQDADKTNPPADQKPVVTREAPKDPLLGKFDLKTTGTDSGEQVRQRLELNLSNDKDLFLFGNRTTTYPTTRNPGQDYQPALPQASPKDTYSIGIGKRF